MTDIAWAPGDKADYWTSDISRERSRESVIVVDTETSNKTHMERVFGEDHITCEKVEATGVIS